MLIRKNTKAFKTILEIIEACQSRADREKLVRLYITKAGHSIKDRISVEAIQGEAGLFYEMNYQHVLNHLRSSGHQLHMSDEVPGIYLFHSASNKVWDETPFEFDESVKKEFASLPELPAVRKKEKSQKFVIPAARLKHESPFKPETPVKKSTVETAKGAGVSKKESKQPGFRLKPKIQFSDLNKVIYRQPQLIREDVLNYYYKIADYILPYLKDRPLSAHRYSGNTQSVVEMREEVLFENNKQMPGWIQDTTVSLDTEKRQILLCNDKEHLLFYVDMGCLQFNAAHGRTKSPDSPDYMVIAIESPESYLAKAIDVALTAREVLAGLQLPSFVMTGGTSAFHVYIPLDSKSKMAASKNAAEYICKLIGLKIPDLVTREGSDYVYGKVLLDYSLNEPGKRLIVPYSLMHGPVPAVAAPLLWEDLKDGLRYEDFNYETIFKKLKQTGDPFGMLFKKKINADTLLKKLADNYSFLF